MESRFGVYNGISNEAVQAVTVLAGSPEHRPAGETFSTVVFCEFRQAEAEVIIAIHRYRWGRRNWGCMWQLQSVEWKDNIEPTPEDVLQDAEAWRDGEMPSR